ncbi:hypothetical protein LRC484719_47880 [Mycobacterium riyadhense]
MQIDGAGCRGFEQGLACPEVVRRSSWRQARPVIDLAMRQAPDARVGEYADGGVEDLETTFGI